MQPQTRFVYLPLCAKAEIACETPVCLVVHVMQCLIVCDPTPEAVGALQEHPKDKQAGKPHVLSPGLIYMHRESE